MMSPTKNVVATGRLTLRITGCRQRRSILGTYASQARTHHERRNDSSQRISSGSRHLAAISSGIPAARAIAIAERHIDADYVTSRTTGFDEVRRAAVEASLGCGVPTGWFRTRRFERKLERIRRLGGRDRERLGRGSLH